MDILVVDDDFETLNLLKMFLEKERHTPTITETAQGGLDCLRGKAYPLVFLDIHLPDQIGIDVLKVIKEHYPTTSVVMMTGYNEAGTVVEAFRSGAMDCILKPFNFEYLKLNILSRFPS